MILALPTATHVDRYAVTELERARAAQVMYDSAMATGVEEQMSHQMTLHSKQASSKVPHANTNSNNSNTSAINTTRGGGVGSFSGGGGLTGTAIKGVPFELPLDFPSQPRSSRGGGVRPVPGRSM